MASYTVEELNAVQKAYEDMLSSIHPYVNDTKQLALIEDAYRYCLEKYDGKYLLSGKAYMLHLIDMAKIAVLEVGLGYISVVGAFLHGITYKSGVSIAEIEERFGKTVAVIMDGFGKISALKTEKVAYNSDNFRVLFLSLIEDMRVVLLKVVHRVYDVRNQSDVDADRLGKYFHEIKYIYIPIVHRLGLYKIKAELEQMLMRYETPEMYAEIERKLLDTEKDRQKTMDGFLAPIIKGLDSEVEHSKRSGKCKFSYSVKWRLKSIASIYAKMKAKDVPFEEVYDLLAARIVIDCAEKDEIECCWMVYSVISNLYEPNPDRMRDWITKPKASGYESLHITVKYNEKLWIEVQIRSTRMDEIAETGQAAHYLYKGEKSSSEEWLLNVRTVLENPSMVSFENSYKRLYKSDKIFIFTPEGDLKQLPLGSTVLDFAYEVHTKVGETCSGAKVNGRVVPIRYVLNNGDKVEIITNKRQLPRADWLNCVVTEKAKNKIRRFLKEEELKESELGKGLLHRRLKNWKLPINEDVIGFLVNEFKLDNALQLYHQISTEKIDLADVKHLLEAKIAEKDVHQEKVAAEVVAKREDNVLTEECLSIGKDIENVSYKLAKCCNPIPGDKVFGFVTNDGNITLHRVNCPNAKSLQQRYDYRIINVKWNGVESGISQATIHIYGHDVIGLLGKVTKVISEDLAVNMKNISLNSDKEGFFEGKIVVQIPDIDSLEQLMDRLRGIEGILEVMRIDE